MIAREDKIFGVNIAHSGTLGTSRPQPGKRTEKRLFFSKNI